MYFTFYSSAYILQVIYMPEYNIVMNVGVASVMVNMGPFQRPHAR